MKNLYLDFDVLLISSGKGVATRSRNKDEAGNGIVTFDAFRGHAGIFYDIDKVARESGAYCHHSDSAGR